MVILKQLYSETELFDKLFDKVTFRQGINIIQGVYTRSEKERSGLNGIGKSTLVRLIDFALVSDSTRNHDFDIKRYNFLKRHSVVLEFEVEGISYFIKRAFDNPRKPKFGTDIYSLESYEEAELRTILGNLFFGRSDYDGYFESTWFRNLINFFIKDDINNFRREDPLKFVDHHTKHFENYSYNLFLLDLPNKSITDFAGLEGDIKELKTHKSKVISRLEDETGKKIEEMHSQIRLLDDKINSFEKSIKDYKFLELYTDIENELIDISVSISSLLKKRTLLRRKLNECKRSYEYEIEFDEARVVKIYSESWGVFGDIIKNKLDDVILFRKRLADNRKRFIKNKELELNSEISNISLEISSLEKRRSDLYKILDEKKALDIIKNTYRLLIEEKTRKERLLTSISQVNLLDEDIHKKNKEINNIKLDIPKEMNSVQDKINKISSLFVEIVKETIHVSGMRKVIFDIKPQPKSSSPLNISIDIPKSKALETIRSKILAYDLTVFFNIIESKRKLPHFLIHDGIFHGIGIKTIVRILNFIHSKNLQFPNFQYIITINEDRFVPDDKKEIYGNYNFNLSDCIIATYKDIPEEMIFKREY